MAVHVHLLFAPFPRQQISLQGRLFKRALLIPATAVVESDPPALLVHHRFIHFNGRHLQEALVVRLEPELDVGGVATLRRGARRLPAKELGALLP